MNYSPTYFQKKVYQAVAQIPHGRVITYKELARAVGCNSPRAVGQALKKNPFAPDIPCHRVIASNLSIGGYKGETSDTAKEKKTALLEQEGVFFTAGTLKDADKIFHFPGNK
ncbi:MAG: MGMT family protein [Verrucomicrobiota bacterium]